MKKLIYRIAKYLGLFTLSRRIMRRRLRILCYHGFEVADESGFMPGVFMRADTFRARMTTIARAGYRVLPLQEAVRQLHAGTLPDDALCITLDDGFVSTERIGAPILAEFGFPATLYATTYYMEKGLPVFNLVVQYMFWKTTRRALTLDRPLWGVQGRFDLTDPEARRRLCRAILDHGDAVSAAERHAVCEQLGRLLGVDYATIAADGRFTLLDPDALRRLERMGIDVQLHTHRHRLPADDEAAARREIAENAERLRGILDKDCVHFCYPSGRWQPHQLRWLRELGVASATTCDRGLNHGGVHPLALYRDVDSQTRSAIEFKAELCGFAELLRIVTGRQREIERRRMAISGATVKSNPYTVLGQRTA